MYKFLVSLITIILTIPNAFSAKLIDLKHQPITILQSIQSLSPNQSQLKEINHEVDKNQTNHIRFQQTYDGHPVFGADAVIHIANNNSASLNDFLTRKNISATMNGKIYQNLAIDLQDVPSYVFNKGQAERATQQAILLEQKMQGIKQTVTHTKTQLIIYVDKQTKAHWTYKVSYSTQQITGMPAKPTYLLDAVTLESYLRWDDLQTLSEIEGGGFGGNLKVGKFSYDALPKSLAKLNMQRDNKNQFCYLKNSTVTVKDARKDSIIKFKCAQTDDKHNNIYWNADLDQVNGGYSPSNDALYTGKIINELYQNWYQIPVLTLHDKPMPLLMRVHAKIDNAYWEDGEMTFGDGVRYFYPLVSVGIGAHEISHGFTEQHSCLLYYMQSGAMNESFSDMAAQAAEFYAYHTNNWKIGAEITKEKNTALRYMDDPTKDCKDRDPEDQCSIQNVKDYYDKLDVHYGSGIYNKVFYLMSTAKNWDTKKAFDVMVQANRYYWLPTSEFADAACGVLKATEDYKYDTATVKNAFQQVGIDVRDC